MGCDIKPIGRYLIRFLNFNPRTPVGCDRTIWKPRGTSHRFQSTNPSGVRLGDGAARGDVAEISIHAPQWGATVIPHPVVGSCIISIHAPQWGATLEAHRLAAQMQISIHAPQWGATAAAFAVVAVSSKFQSTHPSGVRRPWTQPSPQFSDFNPRTPVGCDRPLRGLLYGFAISIHAPQWGATTRRAEAAATKAISIHAPQWGATSTLGVVTMPVTFQSTHPSGVRPLVPLFNVLKPIFQSTHPSGVRLTPPESRSHSAIFQSTHPSGVRPGVGRGGRVSGMISIHAPQWGATRRRARTRATTSNFNPRTPVGCDLEMAAKRGDTEAISIHAPQWGATARLGQAGVHRPISIHAPQWGATTITSIGKSGAGDFNPRTPVGCDLHQLDVQLNIIKFQSTHPSGVRRVYYLQSHVTRHISIHAPQWGATTPYLLDKFIQQFQSTHPSGVRQNLKDTINGKAEFQSTHPSGVRPPTPRWSPAFSAISIHAPQWGATPTRISARSTSIYFNPRTPVGCDLRKLYCYPYCVVISIHAPQWGATVDGYHYTRSNTDFNPRTPVGCDRSRIISRRIAA